MLQMVLRSCMHHLNRLSSPLARWRGQTPGVQEPKYWKYCGESEWHYWGVKCHYRARNPVLPSSIPPIWQPGSVKYCVTTNWRIITTHSPYNKSQDFQHSTEFPEEENLTFPPICVWLVSTHLHIPSPGALVPCSWSGDPDRKECWFQARASRQRRDKMILIVTNVTQLVSCVMLSSLLPSSIHIQLK